MSCSVEEIKAQSLAAYNQWAPQWREHARFHSYLAHKDLKDYQNVGVGKAILLIANGYTFEKNLPLIKEHQANIDIMACDKTIGHCISNGIIPTFCLVADANVDYNKYLKPYEKDLQNTTLFQNVCGNPKWTLNGRWKDIYCYVNCDILNSEIEFSMLSKCINQIPAGTNVSNAMGVFVTQSTTENKTIKRQNYFGYDKILLIGFDYCWIDNYYAFSQDGNGKANYMRHHFVKTRSDKFAFTSGNLLFSARWFKDYCKAFNLPFIQCSDDTILDIAHHSDLKSQISYRYKVEDYKIVSDTMKKIAELMNQANVLQEQIIKIGKDHWGEFLRTA